MRRTGRTSAPFIAAWLLLLFLAVPARAEDLFVRFVLNSEDKGEILVRMDPSGDFLVREADLGEAGLRGAAGRTVPIDGDPHVSLASVPGVRFAFDEKTLSLLVDVPPGMFPKRTIDFLPERNKTVLRPKDPGGFLNYGLTYTTADGFAFSSFNGTGQLGARSGDILFLTDGAWTRTPSDSSFVRLMSSLTYDRRETLQRFVAGDAVASSGDLGGNVTLGGFSLSKTYAMDPYFIRFPMANLSGFASTPSEIQVYVDGTRIRTERISPGEFELRNIVDYGGAGVVTVVVKDAFGREERIASPFYFTDVLLSKGLHEYDYHAGFLRERFGEESNRYGSAGFTALHRYGLRENLTAGLRAEGGKGVLNAGPTATWRIGGAGTVTASASAGLRDGGRFGAAGLIRYVYQDRSRNARISWRGFSPDYAVLGEAEGARGGRTEIAAGAGYGTRRFGNLSIDAASLGKRSGPDRKTIALSYSRTLLRRVTLLATARRVREEATSGEIFAGLTYYPGGDLSLSAGYRNSGGADTETLQVQKNAPEGQGYGYRFSAERTDVGDAPVTVVDPFVQYNARRAILTGEYRVEMADAGGTTESARASLSGAVVWVGGTPGLTRPVNDSFGLAYVDRLEGVRVLVNNQEIGRTDREGKVFLPNLASYYENQVAVSDRDIPIEYSLPEVLKIVSPPLRSGSVIRFQATRIQAVTGRIVARLDGKEAPLEYREGIVEAGGRDIAFPTGRKGEFYLENLPPGAHRGRVEYNGSRCRFDLVVPASEELIVDLGEVSCEESR